ncbi:hypothetical protein EGJ05_20525 [Stutzerimonas xanthomarina]|nr:hypothetical protein EGJ05_20525 [Stutzerimonas xanthomarina]
MTFLNQDEHSLCSFRADNTSLKPLTDQTPKFEVTIYSSPLFKRLQPSVQSLTHFGSQTILLAS